MFINMKTPNFKLRFQTSQQTNLNSPIIVSKILVKLEDKKYEICKVTDKSVTFKWNPFRPVWNFQAPYILDGGNFEITKSEAGSIVVLNYFINPVSYILIWFGLVILLITEGQYLGILFLGTLILIFAIVQYNVTKNEGEDLLSDILATD